MKVTLKILDQGLLTTVQDLGRNKFQQFGVSGSGVMDEMAARIANVLIGNAENDALLEITIIGPTIQFEHSCVIAICGADLSATIDHQPFPLWRPVYVKEGAILRFRRPIQGCRVYLAVAGGIDVPIVMNSRSTYLRGGFGGYNGRPLQRGDVIKCSPNFSSMTNKLLSYFKRSINASSYMTVNWTIPFFFSSYVNNHHEINYIKGPQFAQFTKEAVAKFESASYKVSPNADRMGYRMQGPALQLATPQELLSEAVPKGTIQVPEDGQPIVLMSDRQTIGGYPKIGYVATISMPSLAQVMPGGKLTFKRISIEKAQNDLIKREREFSLLKTSLSLKIRGLSYATN